MIRQRPTWQTQALCKGGASEGGVFRKINALCTLLCTQGKEIGKPLQMVCELWEVRIQSSGRMVNTPARSLQVPG